MPAVTFPEPEGFDDLTRKERNRLRRAWRHDPKTIAAKKAAAAKFDAEAAKAFDKFVLSPVLPLIEPELRKLLKDTTPKDDDDKDDVIDEVKDKMRKKLDALAAFENLKVTIPVPGLGAAAAALAELWSDRLIVKALDRLEFKIRDVLERLLDEAARRAGR